MWWKISLCCFGFFFLLDLSCTSNEKPALDGEQLAKLYCVGCHLYPEPDVLDQKSWEEYLLPRMGYMLGIYPNDSIRADLLGQAAEASLIEKRQIYPKGPRLDAAEWEAIKRFYLKQAPASLPIPKTTKIHPELPNFQTRMPNFRLSPPSTTFIKLNKDGTLLLGDAHTKAFYQIGNDLTIQQAANSGEGVVHVEQRADAYRLTVMGTFSPNDLAKGMIFELPLSKQEAPRILIKGLQRPVHHSSADLNADGLEDIVICEFAKWTGGLSWWEQQRNGQYSKHLLRERPGATKAYVRDFNGDDKPDVIALFGQGDEGIFLYLNQGDGQFIAIRLFR
ncbi:MAG: VCBS repeat-containing protein [Bacteroidota bacterium]